MSEITPLIHKLAEGPLKTDYGEFVMSVFSDGHEQATVLSMGDLSGIDPVLCRIHSECISSHVFFSKLCDCTEQMILSQREISKQNRGIIIHLSQEGLGWGAAAHVSTLRLKTNGVTQPEAYKMMGFEKDIRRYDLAAKILIHYCVQSVKLISSNHNKRKALEAWNIAVPDMDCLETTTRLDVRKGHILVSQDHHPLDRDRNHVFIIGDLNVDYILSSKNLASFIVDKPKPIVGGTAFNAALAFKNKGLIPIVCGKFGRDREGEAIIARLQEESIRTLYNVDPEKPSGQCYIVFFEDMNKRCLIQESDNANDYDITLIEDSINYARLQHGDLVFLVTHSFVRRGIEHTEEILRLLAGKGATIVIDIVPHNIYNTITDVEFIKTVKGKVRCVIVEYATIMKLLNRQHVSQNPTTEDARYILTTLSIRLLVLRYGTGDISKQVVYTLDDENNVVPEEVKDTGYERLASKERIGFGDKLTADILIQYRDLLVGE